MDKTTPQYPAPLTPDAADVAYLLVALEAIPREELPDGPDRRALAMLIRAGCVDNLYTPFGADYHLIAWKAPAHVDPRERLSDWLAARRDVQRGYCDLPTPPTMGGQD